MMRSLNSFFTLIFNLSKVVTRIICSILGPERCDATFKYVIGRYVSKTRGNDRDIAVKKEREMIKISPCTENA